MKYEDIRQDLLRMKSELEERLHKTQKEITHAEGPPDPDFAEQAVERQNEDVVYGLDKSARIELAQVKKALDRIQNAEYGFCLECGEPIPHERLKAVPFTGFCKGCVEENDSNYIS